VTGAVSELYWLCLPVRRNLTIKICNAAVWGTAYIFHWEAGHACIVNFPGESFSGIVSPRQATTRICGASVTIIGQQPNSKPSTEQKRNVSDVDNCPNKNKGWGPTRQEGSNAISLAIIHHREQKRRSVWSIFLKSGQYLFRYQWYRYLVPGTYVPGMYVLVPYIL
jgi:hypothetical protein